MSSAALVSVPMFFVLAVVTMYTGALETSTFNLLPQQPLARKPPRIPLNPLLSPTLLTDQSNYVNLGDHVGSVLAIGDFSADRYSDLLIVQNTYRLRTIAILCWQHHSFSFRPSQPPSNGSFTATFSIDSIPSIASDATVASATTMDANSDGLLDVLLVIRLAEDHYVAAVLLGDGTGCLAFDQILPDINPYALVMDANDDMQSDIFFTNDMGERIFYINDPPGQFERYIWRPWSDSVHCVPTYPFNSNSFADINGDCAPDLVITTSCGMEVWLNREPSRTAGSAWPNGHYFRKLAHSFHHMSLPRDTKHFLLLNHSVWSPMNGDGHAVYADFNADGALDIAVLNPHHRSVRVSYGVRHARVHRRLCAVDQAAHFETRLALTDIAVSETNLGSTIIPPMIHAGDFNFDGLIDVLLVDADSGTLSLHAATIASDKVGWFDRATRPVSSLLQRILFPITGSTSAGNAPPRADAVTYIRYIDSPILHHMEDPLGAAFFDVDESGRQDILVSQRHGTRLVWNNYQNMDDSVYFKATGVNAPRTLKSTSPISATSRSYSQPFSPLPGNTFKVSYGGRHRRETQICTQCPQSSVLTLQPCSCLFGITRIANYIEEMAMGGAGGVRAWMALMPNALAIIWPQQFEPGTPIKWKVSYLSKGRDGQLKRIVLVLCITLAVLLVAIVYMHNVERRKDNDNRNFDFGYTYT